MEPQSISCPLVLQVSTNCYHYKFMKCVYVPNRGKIWWYFANKHVYKFENFLKLQIINELDRTIGGLGWLANCSWFRGAPIKMRGEARCFDKITIFINTCLDSWKILYFKIISTISYILVGLLNLVYMETAFDRDLACASFSLKPIIDTWIPFISRLHMVDL